MSAETVKDFQLRPGDLLRLRLQDGAHASSFTTVPFHYAGVAKEFPTAPTDSFLVANADYVARATGSDAVGTFLVQTDGTSPARGRRARARRRSGTARRSPTSSDQRKVVGSNLTAVELSGLTKVELGFALVLAVAASGLALGARLPASAGARSRSPRALGARRAPARRVRVGRVAVRHRPAASRSAPRSPRRSREMLVKVLTGVFDPPPDALAVPWGYLGARRGAHRRRPSAPPAR